MPITDPSQLVEAFKKSGEFDKLRRELLADSQRSTGFDAFKARIDEIARERIKSGQMAYTAPDMLHRELMQEVNRFPVVERFASEVPMLSDNAFKQGINSSIQRILREDRGQQDLSSTAASSQPHTDSASAQDEKTALMPPAPPQEAPMVPLVSRRSPVEARVGGKQIDTLEPAPLTTAPETNKSGSVSLSGASS
ncbi:hypothetical protein B0H15DRAFT_842990 [Mycena belliarum]|uniref:BOD1/SHG1 domain-containing protein n=1 Tax=Mycena belliarum TaxID=1033014 RepID=A0AAD6U428_9AGAR|nr:hypothetical protein B0H15DRAFT_842990 [Mycena belliae]